MLTEKIINNIKHYINQNQIKQTWMVDMLDTNKMTINNILNMKKKNITLDELESIAEVLDLSIEELSLQDFQGKVIDLEASHRDELQISFYGDGGDEKAVEAVRHLVKMMDIMNTVKSANEDIKSMGY